ncbi:hypothetical protein B0G52_10836 [Cohnella sp. SGD-V74]|nr:hypothetical protein B0G52_10836 [Cohnella sp. SGD-V74]
MSVSQYGGNTGTPDGPVLERCVAEKIGYTTDSWEVAL